MCVTLEDIDMTTELDQLEVAELQCRAFDFVTCTIVIGIFCLLGLAGNATSFLVLTKHKTETSTIFLLQCLAVSDGILLVITLIVYSLPGIYPYTHKLKLIHEGCESIKTYIWPLSLIAHTTTVWLTVLVTSTRYMSVCHPTKQQRNNTLLEVRFLALIVITVSLIYNIPRFFEHTEIYKVPDPSNGTDSYDKNTTYSSFILGDSKVYQIIYSNILYFPVMYIIPLLSLAYMNSRLIKTIGALKTRRESLTGHKCRRDYITHCIIVLVCVFILCQTPALINQIFWAVTSNDDRKCGRFHFYYTKISDVLVVINSSTNFIIYCLFGKSFRKIFLETLCLKRICGSAHDKGTPVSEQPLDDICALCKSFREDRNLMSHDQENISRCSCKANETHTKTTNTEHEKITNIDHGTESVMQITYSNRNSLLVPSNKPI